MKSKFINALIIEGISFPLNLVDNIVRRISGSTPFSFQLSAFSCCFLCIISAVGIIGLGLSFVACVAPTSLEPGVEKDISPVYAVEGQTKGIEECARCHKRICDLIIAQGGKHKIECERCHEQFHVDTKGTGDVHQEDILPKCESCHKQVHGADLALCSECHIEAHAPLNIPAERALESGCYICHPEVDREMKTYVTQHTDMLYCSSCHHTRHRHVPECMECHNPHATGMTHAECLTCHPPHKALQVAYAEDIPSESCAVCHRDVYDTLKQSGRKHRKVSCAKCHPEKHRNILRCKECHPDVHGDEMMEKFRLCGSCHGVAHNIES